MADLPFETLLWVAARPLLRLFLCIICGYSITRAGFFPVNATRGAVQVVLNITLPSLMFSKASVVLNADNDAALGPVIVIAIIYMAIGLIFSLSIKQIFWVPYRFRYGILVAGGWASSCDITISVMTDIMASLPFDGLYDQNLAVTYTGVFCVIFYLTIFTCGRYFIERDVIGPDVDEGEVYRPCQTKCWKLLLAFLRGVKSASSSEAVEKHDPERDACGDQISNKDLSLSPQLSSLEHSQAVSSLASSTTMQHDIPSGDSGQCNETQSSIHTELHIMPVSADNSSPLQTRPAGRYVKFLSNLSSPLVLSLVVSLIVSRVSTLQALFIPNVPGTNIPPAPDGQPLLAFVMDAATFLGAANSPIGLIIIGSVLARLSIPRGRWSSLPLGAIATLAICKQLIMPVFGILICKGFIQIGFIDAQDKVLIFVCIVVSCLPIACTQVILTQACSDTNAIDHLVAFLLPQLIMMPWVMILLMAFTLNVLFG
ncbi:auxin efflux carrier [Suillus spraguei]|nr:auxin efflux carrier [Suillus spraguei]